MKNRKKKYSRLNFTTSMSSHLCALHARPKILYNLFYEFNEDIHSASSCGLLVIRLHSVKVLLDIFKSFLSAIKKNAVGSFLSYQYQNKK